MDIVQYIPPHIVLNNKPMSINYLGNIDCSYDIHVKQGFRSLLRECTLVFFLKPVRIVSKVYLATPQEQHS